MSLHKETLDLIEAARVRSLRERLAACGAEPEVLKCALTSEDIDLHHLPSDFSKTSDSRRARFVAEHGDRCVELDALPPDVLETRLRTEVEARMELDALDHVHELEDEEREHLRDALAGAA